jgi:tRNA (guanine-N(7)-)-methyltransferase subunit TRM82
MPGGEALLQALQGSSSLIEGATEVAWAAEAAELAMRKLMTKRQYTIEQRENRKRMRNDKKLENKSV